MDLEFIKLLVGGGVGALVAGWLLVKTIPGIVAEFRAEAAEQRTLFRQELAELRESHAGQLASVHGMMQEQQKQIVDALLTLDKK